LLLNQNAWEALRLVSGFAMLCAEAGEVLAIVHSARLGGVPYAEFRDAIFTHTVMAEGLNGLLGNVPPTVDALGGSS
jgi:hypothetical protein